MYVVQILSFFEGKMNLLVGKILSVFNYLLEFFGLEFFIVHKKAYVTCRVNIQEL